MAVLKHRHHLPRLISERTFLIGSHRVYYASWRDPRLFPGTTEAETRRWDSVMRMGSGFWRFEGSESKTGNPDEWKMLTNDHGTRTEGEGKTSRHKRSTMILTLPENMLQLAVASSATARPPSPVGLLTHAIARIPSTKAATSTLRDTVPSPAKPRAASPIGLVAQAVARIPSLKQGEWKVRVIADREEAKSSTSDSPYVSLRYLTRR